MAGRTVDSQILYDRAYREFVDTKMVSHAFFFVFYREIFNQYYLDMRDGIVL